MACACGLLQEVNLWTRLFWQLVKLQVRGDNWIPHRPISNDTNKQFGHYRIIYCLTSLFFLNLLILLFYIWCFRSCVKRTFSQSHSKMWFIHVLVFSVRQILHEAIRFFYRFFNNHKYIDCLHHICITAVCIFGQQLYL